MGNILRLAGPGSLVLIDEFGKGTSPASGIALLAAAIRSLLQSKAKVVCTTHFVEVFSMDMLRDGESGLKALQMSVKIPKKSTDLAIPLFKLDEGVADSSAGLACAKMAGLKQGIIDRAGELIKATKDGEEIRPLEEILRNDLPFSELEIDVLRRLVDNDWSEATDLVIENFLEGIRQLRKAK
jgi:DNA mismatch repair protein MSH5